MTCRQGGLSLGFASFILSNGWLVLLPVEYFFSNKAIFTSLTFESFGIECMQHVNFSIAAIVLPSILSLLPRDAKALIKF